MLKILNDIQPDKEVLDALASYQKQINDLPTFDEKRAKAKELFLARNKKGNRIFDAIKVSLLKISPGIERCAYCEDSQCDEVEHIYPKDLYPLFCFLWSNYVYACGICNGPKNNKFAIFRLDNGAFVEVNLNKNDKGELLPPPEGSTVFVNPREDEPLDFCRLDFLTFEFSIIAPKGTKEYIRADYTYNNVLRLNQREGLRERRKNAFHDYKDRLNAYTLSKNLGKSQDKLDKMIQRLKTSDHPTVWKEMQRQHTLGRLIKIDSDLDSLFQQLPEALTW